MKASPVWCSSNGHTDPVRRRLLRYGLNGLGLIACGRPLLASNGAPPASGLNVRPVALAHSGVDGLLLPEGFAARVIARSGRPVGDSDYAWHPAPDGGAVFAAGDGGWIYVSNSEMLDGRGGVSAVRFDAGGGIRDAYPLLTGTSGNCAGGLTPWGTWLSCEEMPRGRVWECDPLGELSPRVLPALGEFMHEAVVVDPDRLQLYLTEDRWDGRFYRFTPDRATDGIPDLTRGTLEMARVRNLPEGLVDWHPVVDPAGGRVPTRHQVPDSTPFRGGEGAWYADRLVYFTTKHDNRVWAYDIDDELMTLVYDDDFFPDPVLTGVDNVTVSQAGTIYVAEDGGNMEIVAINPGREVFPILRLAGHAGSEITGPAFDPTGSRLYFSSQRGAAGLSQHGVTYEVTGPFHGHG